MPGLESEPSWWAPILCENEAAESAPKRGESNSEPTGTGAAQRKSKRTEAVAGLDVPSCSPIKKVRDDDLTPEVTGEDSKTP